MYLEILDSYWIGMPSVRTNGQINTLLFLVFSSYLSMVKKKKEEEKTNNASLILLQISKIL